MSPRLSDMRWLVWYDPTKAQFTTFVNWQIRGELQSLRFRLMTDQRPSAKKVEATTVSLHQTTAGAEGEERPRSSRSWSTRTRSNGRSLPRPTIWPAPPRSA
jgi:hypothetical protein